MAQFIVKDDIIWTVTDPTCGYASASHPRYGVLDEFVCCSTENSTATCKLQLPREVQNIKVGLNSTVYTFDTNMATTPGLWPVEELKVVSMCCAALYLFSIYTYTSIYVNLHCLSVCVSCSCPTWHALTLHTEEALYIFFASSCALPRRPPHVRWHVPHMPTRYIASLSFSLLIVVSCAHVTSHTWTCRSHHAQLCAI